MTKPEMSYLRTLILGHGGDCVLLGVTPDLTVYVDEFYGTWLAQHGIRVDGEWIASVTEDADKVHRLPVPRNLICPCREPQTRELNFSGARQRGLQELERVREVVSPLSMEEQMLVIQKLGLAIPPPMLLGLAESTVLSEAELNTPGVFIVCRRLAFAYALPQKQRDAEGQWYDYDTRVVYVAHYYDRGVHEPHALEAAFAGLNGETLHRPMDCVLVNYHLFVADSGGETGVNRVHIWTVARE